MYQIAIMGFGTIGSGVFELVRENKEVLKRHAGDDVNVKYVLDIRQFPGQPVEEVLTNDVNDILNDPEVSVVVETMGGINPAFKFVSGALAAGKSVATSNKELVAAKGTELLALARENHVSFLFEASVGGGIPLLRPVMNALTADRLESVTGILNGTTNYILTRMDEAGADFADALAEAQAMGYAERNPSADVDGHDAKRKLAIIMSIISGHFVDAEAIPTVGVSGITAADIAAAKEAGYDIKLLARGELTDGRVYARVSPYMVPPENPLNPVRGVFNSILIHGNMVDDVMFYGRGAGKEATASAVVGDVVDELKHPGETIYPGWSAEPAAVVPDGDERCAFFVRVSSVEAEEACKILPAVRCVGLADNECGILTEVMKESDLEEAGKKMEFISVIRVL
ncbi:MAG: homoserine dehydrogenase [Lachnospiraceae bacterium]|nr:homoserine dehydrogenase [Lachnospiraceae bacterium]